MGEDTIFISQTKLARRWGVSVRTLQRKRKDADFPKPDLYFGDIPHWRIERIIEFERALMAAALNDPQAALARLKQLKAHAKAKSKVEQAALSKPTLKPINKHKEAPDKS